MSGTWDGGTANWNTTADGTTAAETFTSGGDAIFSAGTSAIGQTYTVTVSTTRNVSSIDVQHGTVTFTGGTAINFNDATPTFTVGSGLTTTVNTNITSSGTGSNLTKAGAGTLVFASNDKGYTGTTNITAGTLDLAFNQSFSTVNLSGGTLKLSSATNTITNLNVTATSTIDFGGAVASLTATNFTIATGVTLNIINWTGASDHFYVTNWLDGGSGAGVRDTTNAAPMNQVVFASFPASSTGWRTGTNEVAPIPEPSTYGALLLGATTGLMLWRRRRNRLTKAD